LDGRRLTAAEAALVRLRVRLSLLGTHDPAELALWPASKFAGARVGSPLTIALGEGGDEVGVWSGEVTGVAAGPDGVLLDGLAATVALSRRRTSQAYLDQSVAAIVRSLVADVPIDEVSGDATLPAYNVDDRRSVWAHLVDLAGLVGADIAASPTGGLRFVAPRTGQPELRLRYGADVLAWSAGGVPRPVVPTVVPHGAGSEAGAAQWHWIRRDAGAASDRPLRVVAAFATRDGADGLRRALAARAARASVRGQIRAIGAPGIRPGSVVAVSDLPSGDPGPLRVLAVEHVLDVRDGFITTLAVEGGGA
jgi:hypothetical protein